MLLQWRSGGGQLLFGASCPVLPVVGQAGCGERGNYIGRPRPRRCESRSRTGVGLASIGPVCTRHFPDRRSRNGEPVLIRDGLAAVLGAAVVAARLIEGPARGGVAPSVRDGAPTWRHRPVAKLSWLPKAERLVGGLGPSRLVRRIAARTNRPS